MNYHLISRRFLTATAFAAVAWTGGSLISAYSEAHQRVKVSVQNRDKFANVAVLLDDTRSMGLDNATYGRQIVRNGILPACGLGDKLSVYQLSPDAGLLNLVSGGTIDEQPPQFSDPERTEILQVLREARADAAPGRVNEKMYSLADQLKPQWRPLDAIHERWARAIATKAPPKDLGTNISSALEAIDAYFKGASDPNEEKYLFLISDLIEEAARRANGPPLKTAVELRGVRVTLIYPHDSKHDWNQVIGSWRKYFGERRVEIYPFSSALNRATLLRPNPTTGLEHCTRKDVWSSLSPLLSLERLAMLWISPVLAVAILGLALHHKARASVRWEGPPQ